MKTGQLMPIAAAALLIAFTAGYPANGQSARRDRPNDNDSPVTLEGGSLRVLGRGDSKIKKLSKDLEININGIPRWIRNERNHLNQVIELGEKRPWTVWVLPQGVKATYVPKSKNGGPKLLVSATRPGDRFDDGANNEQEQKHKDKDGNDYGFGSVVVTFGGDPPVELCGKCDQLAKPCYATFWVTAKPGGPLPLR